MDYPVPRSYFAVVNGLVDTSYSVPDLFSPELECNVHIDVGFHLQSNECSLRQYCMYLSCYYTHQFLSLY